MFWILSKWLPWQQGAVKELPSLWTVWLLSDIQSVLPTEDAVGNPAREGVKQQQRERDWERGADSEGRASRQTGREPLAV